VRRVTNERVSGLALIAGSLATILTLSLHPSGPIAPERIESVARMLIAVHALALASLPFLFMGAFGMSRRLALAGRLPMVALVLYAFALVSVMNAAVADGLVSPHILREFVNATPATRDGWRMALRYNGWLDEAFAQVYVVASSLAILLWSAAMLSSAVSSSMVTPRSGAPTRGVGIYGCFLAPVILIAMFSGLFSRAPHALAMVVLGEALWFIAVGALLFWADQAPHG